MSTKPTAVNIIIEEGSNYTLSLLWTSKSTNLPMNITGYTAKLQVRTSYESTTVLIEKSTALGNVILGGTAGTVDVLFLPVDTLNLSWSRAIYDLLLTDPTGVVTKLVKGEFTIQQTVTVLP